MKTFRVIHQIPGVHFEKSGEQQPCFVSEVRARSVFNLREIALADLLFQLFADGANHFKLRHVTAQTAKIAFHQAEIA